MVSPDAEPARPRLCLGRRRRVAPRASFRRGAGAAEPGSALPQPRARRVPARGRHHRPARRLHRAGSAAQPRRPAEYPCRCVDRHPTEASAAGVRAVSSRERIERSRFPTSKPNGSRLTAPNQPTRLWSDLRVGPRASDPENAGSRGAEYPPTLGCRYEQLDPMGIGPDRCRGGRRRHRVGGGRERVGPPE